MFAVKRYAACVPRFLLVLHIDEVGDKLDVCFFLHVGSYGHLFCLAADRLGHGAASVVAVFGRVWLRFVVVGLVPAIPV